MWGENVEFVKDVPTITHANHRQRWEHCISADKSIEPGSVLSLMLLNMLQFVDDDDNDEGSFPFNFSFERGKRKKIINLSSYLFLSVCLSRAKTLMTR